MDVYDVLLRHAPLGSWCFLVTTSTQLQQQLLVIPRGITLRNPEKTHHITSTRWLSFDRQNDKNSGTYWDISVQWFSVGLQILLPDVQHIYLGAGHHDTDEGSVLCPCSLWAQCNTSFMSSPFSLHKIRALN